MYDSDEYRSFQVAPVPPRRRRCGKFGKSQSRSKPNESKGLRLAWDAYFSIDTSAPNDAARFEALAAVRVAMKGNHR